MMKCLAPVLPRGLLSFLAGFIRGYLRKKPDDMALFAMYYCLELQKYKHENPTYSVDRLIKEFHKHRAHRLCGAAYEQEMLMFGYQASSNENVDFEALQISSKESKMWSDVKNITTHTTGDRGATGLTATARPTPPIATTKPASLAASTCPSLHAVITSSGASGAPVLPAAPAPLTLAQGETHTQRLATQQQPKPETITSISGATHPDAPSESRKMPDSSRRGIPPPFHQPAQHHHHYYFAHPPPTPGQPVSPGFFSAGQPFLPAHQPHWCQAPPALGHHYGYPPNPNNSYTGYMAPNLAPSHCGHIPSGHHHSHQHPDPQPRQRPRMATGMSEGKSENVTPSKWLNLPSFLHHMLDSGTPLPHGGPKGECSGSNHPTTQVSHWTQCQPRQETKPCSAPVDKVDVGNTKPQEGLSS